MCSETRSDAALLEPDDPGDRWIGQMRRGNFSAAWDISDAILKSRAALPCWHLPRHEQYIWRGEPLAGRRVLVHCYHGLGDTVQFIRYADPLRAIAREVIVWAQPALLPLLATVRGIDRLVPLHDGEPNIAREVDVEVMELAYIFRSTPANLPAGVPYIFPRPIPQASRKFPRPRLAPRVGLAWRAGPWDARRSLPFPLLAPLLEISGLEFFSLQAGAGANEWTGPASHRLGDGTIEDTARAMQGLDLVISVDSFPAHLAGALGCRTWTLLPTVADWRWLEGRDDSPWYPTLRLFRQPAPGAWEPVVDAIAEQLKALARAADSERIQFLDTRAGVVSSGAAPA